jgi:hypothetical protein
MVEQTRNTDTEGIARFTGIIPGSQALMTEVIE